MVVGDGVGVIYMEKKIIIVGGGFGGVQAALALSRAKLLNTRIILVSDKPHLEYTPALYRVVTGSSPLEVCIPLSEIFEGSGVEVVEDRIVGLNIEMKSLGGASGSLYVFDECILALGSETTYFDIPGLKEYSFGFKSIHNALRLKRHFHELFERCLSGTSETEVCSCHVVIVGGGASGVELAGNLSPYLKSLAKKHGFSDSFVTIDLVEASSRILPALPEDVADLVVHRLRALNVNIFLNRSIVKSDVEGVFFKDMEMKTKTLIWAAGIKANQFYANAKGFLLDKKGRVVVDDFLRPEGISSIYVVGDGASTPYSGMAQTAIRDANFVANNIVRASRGKKMCIYRPLPTPHVLPVGEGWAAALIGHWRFYGRIGWWLRRAADFRYFLSILPFRKALRVFREGDSLCESCGICSPENE